MIEVGTHIQGRLRPEVIKPLVRQNFPKLRACYEAQLKKDEAATGIVRSEFIIDQQGKVTKLQITVSGALPDPALVPCWASVVNALRFRRPRRARCWSATRSTCRATSNEIAYFALRRSA